jgi:hypothetical protein
MQVTKVIYTVFFIIFLVWAGIKIAQIKQPKWEYRIELIDQNSARINNGKETKTIAFDSIQSYITKDNE